MGVHVSKDPAALTPDGSKVKVRFEADLTSPINGEEKSVISEPLDRFFSAEQAWDAFETFHRNGSRFTGAASDGAGRCSTVELGGSGFLTEYTLAAGSTMTSIVLLHEFDRNKFEWTTRKYRDSPPTEDGLEVTNCVRFHRRPFVVEAWSVRRGRAHRPSCQELEGTLRDLVEEVLRLAKVPPQEVGVTSCGLWSATSGPLDGLLSPETFWKAFLAINRKRAEQAKAAGSKLSPFPGGFALARDGIHQSNCLDKVQDQWVSTEHGGDAKHKRIEGMTITQVHRNPFRIELRSEQPPVRLSGPGLRDQMQEVLGHVLARAAETPDFELWRLLFGYREPEDQG